MEVGNGTGLISIDSKDSAWLLTNVFLLFAMQTGLALRESGCVSSKNAANIMMKSTAGATVGGLAFWAIGYGLSFGDPSTAFFGMHNFFLQNDAGLESMYADYLFQVALATTSITIISGAVAERMRLAAYIAFSFINTFLYVLPACWIWTGFLKLIGFLDIGGSCAVHYRAGISALVATLYLGPRLGRFTIDDQYQMSSPVTALTGMFLIWWAWLGFNCGSSLKLAALAVVNTFNSSVAGGVCSLILSYWLHRGHFKIEMVINAILGGLASVTGICGYTTPHEALLIGLIGALLSLGTVPVLEQLHIDDPVGIIPVHCISACWGTLAVGLFTSSGLLHGGGLQLLGIQMLGLICVTLWTGVTVSLTLFIMDKVMRRGIRLSTDEELLGADWVEHSVHSETMALKLEKALKRIDPSGNETPELALAKVFGELLQNISDSQRIRQINVREPGSILIDRIPEVVLRDQKATLEYAKERAVTQQEQLSIATDLNALSQPPGSSNQPRKSSVGSVSSISSIKSGKVGDLSQEEGARDDLEGSFLGPNMEELQIEETASRLASRRSSSISSISSIKSGILGQSFEEAANDAEGNIVGVHVIEEDIDAVGDRPDSVGSLSSVRSIRSGILGKGMPPPVDSIDQTWEPSASLGIPKVRSGSATSIRSNIFLPPREGSLEDAPEVILEAQELKLVQIPNQIDS